MEITQNNKQKNINKIIVSSNPGLYYSVITSKSQQVSDVDGGSQNWQQYQGTRQNLECVCTETATEQ